jgi:hypothetical protein
MESAILGTMDDIDTLRAKLLAEADSMQIESTRPDSKAAKIRALYPTLVEIKERSPNVTYVALAKMLTKIGIDVKADAVMKAMASVREAELGSGARKKTRIPRAAHAANPAVKKKPSPLSTTLSVTPTNNTAAEKKQDEHNVIHTRNPKDPV